MNKILLLFIFLPFAVFAEPLDTPADVAAETAAIEIGNSTLRTQIKAMRARLAAIQVAQAEQAKLVAEIAKRIMVNAPDLKTAEDIRIAAARVLFLDPNAVRAILGDPSSPVVFKGPLVINYEVDGKRCWTHGGSFSFVNGKPSCSISVILAPHSFGKKDISQKDAYKWMMDQCLSHELLGHAACYMRFGPRGGDVPLWAHEGTAMLHQTPEVVQRYLGQLNSFVAEKGLPFTIQQLFSMTAYPSNDKEMHRFYDQSTALAQMLVSRITEQRGPEVNVNDYQTIVISFALAIKDRGWDAAVAQYAKTFGFKPNMTQAQLEQMLRGYIEEKGTTAK